MIHRTVVVLGITALVVNCYQNTNFSDDSQAINQIKPSKIVVNCFQNTNFSDDSQGNGLLSAADKGCELLSEY